MKYFFTRMLLFLLPAILWLITVVVIDPYNYFSTSASLIDNETKLSISYRLNYPLYKLIDFKKNPTERILLGDSRVENLKEEDIEKITGHNYTNLGYGGGSLKETIDTFWEIVKYTELKEVYIGLNIFNYNSFQSRDRVSEAISLTDNPFSYVASNYANKASLLILKSKILGVDPNVGIPESSKDQFWKSQLTYADKIYGLYGYPEKYHKGLQEIAEYCHQNNIKLVFFSPPSHSDLHDKIKAFNLVENENQFRNDIKKLGNFYDFDIVGGKLSLDKNNFKDPFHVSQETSKLVIKELFSGNYTHGEFHKCQTCKLSNKESTIQN